MDVMSQILKSLHAFHIGQWEIREDIMQRLLV
jgi:hypothetical protein